MRSHVAPMTIPPRVYLVVGLALVSGCGRPFHRNQPLARYDGQSGYRFDALELGERNSDALFVCVSFSGGGTRAAAFAYGVLQGLRETTLPAPKPNAETVRLSDEIDVISAVSGGSFTAMGFGLWGDDLFDGRFESRFLTRNVQWELFVNLFHPRNLFLLPFVLLDRIDTAADYYDRTVFEQRTYGDLLARKRRPFIVVNATDVARRSRFEFTQDDFDLLGSDLGTLPAGWAVAASSAFPFLLSPLRLKYFPGEPLSDAMGSALADGGAGSQRRRRWAASLATNASGSEAAMNGFDAGNHRYLYLLDGGLADNLGLMHFFESYRSGAIRRRIDAGRIRRLALIIVDAETEPRENLEAQDAAPGLFTVGERTATTGMYNQSALLTSTVKYLLTESRAETREAYRRCDEALGAHCPDAAAPAPPASTSLDAYVIDLNFRRVRDEKQRESLLSMLTTFFLPTADVEALTRTGRTLLQEHPEFHRLMEDLSAGASRDPHVGGR